MHTHFGWVSFRSIVFALLSVLLMSCGGGDEESSGAPPPDDDPGPGDQTSLCESITGGQSSVVAEIDPACSDCQVSDVGRAADADLDSGALAEAGYHAGECTVPIVLCDPPRGFTIRATAQPGVVYAAGMYPGAHWRFSDGAWTTQVRTYLGGELQEETGIGHDSSENEPHSSASAFKATKPFDAVEVFLANERDGETSVIEVRELCWDVPLIRELAEGGR